jgi:hypothetical protein
MQGCGVWTAVIGCDADIYIIGAILILGVLWLKLVVSYWRKKQRTHLHEHIPVSIFIKDVRIQDFVLGYVAITIYIFGHELLVWVSPLRVLV